ncbi:hypothetical protein C2857_005643 [Epichloe festucae Fl1]|uniref:FAD-binding domain-containing protein n=1 Tax=Epichloe festucae (strain Fl1) TaxID=877507 RepID=A0A7S9KL32_EPIFF|nr:hypothetical protein C2857_005643 [Epichloe festucae Fl1]
MIEVIVVGAGISGLTFAVTLARYRNTGNGLQIPCNAAHALRCLGLLERLQVCSRQPATSFKTLAYSDGKELLDRDLEYCEELYGAPWLLMHRADYMRVLRDEASRLGVVVKSGHEVRHIDFSTPAVTLADGHVYKADVIVGSDARPTGEYAYRALLKRSQLSSPSLKHIVSSPGVIRMWLGPQANAVLYTLRNGRLFNLVIPIADAAFNASFAKGDDLLGAVKNWLRDWDPVLLEMLGQADQLVRFPLYQVQTLPYWSPRSTCVTLAGDAAHAMLPHLAQGAATGVEDGFVLGTLLGRWGQQTTTDTSDRALVQRQIHTVLRSYEKLQHERTTRIVSMSRLTGTLDHLPQGPAQRARDAEFTAFVPEKCVSGMPWIDARWNRKLLARKVDEVTEREFQSLMNGGGISSHEQEKKDIIIHQLRCKLSFQ